MAINHANFAETTLGAAITTTDGTSITVSSSAGFPNVDFIIAIDTEVMLVTNVAGTTWTVTRGYESSTAATHLNGATVYHNISAGEVDALVDGPASATDGNLAVFDGATGKLIKDGGAVPAAGLPTTGGTMSGDINMGNNDLSYIRLLKLNGEIDDGNSGTAKTIDWNAGTAHKSTLTGNVTFAFSGYGPTVVPTMSDYTAPSGVASASSTYSNYYAWKAFDKNVGTGWAPNNVAGYLQYQFPTAKTITAYGMQCGNSLPVNWTVEGSNNGTDWITLDTRNNQTLVVDTATYYDIGSPASYAYYRLNILGNNYWMVEEWLLIESSINNPPAPCFLILKLVQDATGGRTVTWPATVKGTLTVNPKANSETYILFYFDGTNFNAIQPSVLTETALATGFTIAGGTTSKTLTVDADVTVSALAPKASPAFTGSPTFPTGTPASADAAGTTGQILWDGSYLYVCTASNTWKRAAIATW